MTDFRALCAELLQELCCNYRSWELKEGYCSDAVTLASAALAQPEPQKPTDEELCEIYRAAYYACDNRQGSAAQAYALRAVLERWRCQ